jgi:predicted RNA-binding protein YlqC (UPF0109 family)
MSIQLDKIVKAIVEPLVNNASVLSVSVSAQPDESGYIKILLNVAKEDMGRVIGKQGKTINAIRTLLIAIASKEGIKTHLDVVEKE